MTAELLTPDMEREAGESPKVLNRVEMTGETLRYVAHIARRSLRFPHSEDFTGEFVCRLLDEASSVGRPNMVRADHVKGAWIKLEARSYAMRTANPQGEELTGELESDEDTGDEDTGGFTRKWKNPPTVPGPEDMESEDFAEEDSPAEFAPVKVRQMAGRIARRAYLHDHPVTVYPLISALARDTVDRAGEPMTGDKLAAIFDMSPDQWKKAVAGGAKFMREAFPTYPALASALVRAARTGELDVARRDTPLAGRKLGKPLPKDSHRTPAQTFREADWLIARPQLDGRTPDAAKASGRDSRTGRTGDEANIAPAAPEVWGEARPATFGELASLYRFRGDTSGAARQGRPAGRYGAARLPSFPMVRGGFASFTPADKPASDISGRTFPHPRFARFDEAGRRVDTRRTGAAPTPEALALLAAWAEAPMVRADRPKLPVWTPGEARRRDTGKRAGSLTGDLPTEDTGGRKLTRADLRRVRRAAPGHRRAAMLRVFTPVSLDVATSDEHRRESDEGFPMVEDLIARASD